MAFMALPGASGAVEGLLMPVRSAKGSVRELLAMTLATMVGESPAAERASPLRAPGVPRGLG